MPSTQARIRARFKEVAGGLGLNITELGLGARNERTIKYDPELETLVVIENE